MDDIELKTNASRSSMAIIKENGIKKMDIVRLSLILNSHATGFCTGSRYVEQHDTLDVRTWWQKLLLRPRVVLAGLLLKSSTQYMERFPSLSIEDAALIKAAFQEGFRRGYEFRFERKRWDDSGGSVGLREIAILKIDQADQRGRESLSSSSLQEAH